MLKKHTQILLLISVLSHFSFAQKNYLSYDQSFFGINFSGSNKNQNGISERVLFCNGTSGALSYHFAINEENSIGIGAGLSSISYQKEFSGIFPENSEFGMANVIGRIGYWSYPITFRHHATKSRRYSHYPRSTHYRYGFAITYIPSFERSNTFSITTYGGADKNIFRTNFRSNEKQFQHALTIGLNDQLFIGKGKAFIGIEPYAGIAGNYFKGSTNDFNFCYGIRFRIGFRANPPSISIEREIQSSGNEAEKKKQLEEKQKEIQEQLNKNPK